MVDMHRQISMNMYLISCLQFSPEEEAEEEPGAQSPPVEANEDSEEDEIGLSEVLRPPRPGSQYTPNEIDAFTSINGTI